MAWRNIFARRGFTLVELLVVVAILSIIATLAVNRVFPVGERAKLIAAESDLKVIQDAIVNEESGYVRDLRGLPQFSLASMRLGNLFSSTNFFGVDSNLEDCRVDRFPWNPDAQKGWRGPYLRGSIASFPKKRAMRFPGDETYEKRGFWPRLDNLRLPDEFLTEKDGASIYGFPGEPTILDPWGNPYVLQIPPPQAFDDGNGGNSNLLPRVRFEYARVVSAGPDGRLQTPCFSANFTNAYFTTWSERERRISRQAGRIDGDNIALRGDDLVLFLVRADVDEGEEARR